MGEHRKRSFAAELAHRRVPQILGLYVAATWMAVEIGEWLSERFGLPETLSSYAFVGLLALAPTIGLLAWAHGAPGRDRWTRFQVVFMSVNVALAAAALVSLVQGPDGVAATETRVVIDETGAERRYEVAREGYHRRLLAFFWSNETGDPELDWLSYGAPWLLVEDILRSPLMTAGTPFDAGLVIDRFRATGFPRGVGEPLSLDLKIAGEHRIRHIATGRIGEGADGVVLTVRLHDVETGDLLGEWQAEGADWLASIDRLSRDLAAELLPLTNDARSVPELSVAEHTSSSIPAIRTLIEGLQKQAFDNDYTGALKAVERAIELDPSFAQAFVQGMNLSRLSGDLITAQAYAERALALDYKLYSERKFLVKSTTYSLQLQSEKAIRVLEMWTQVHPNSAEAFKRLAQAYVFSDGRLDDAQRAVERVLELDPSDQRQFIELARVHRLQGRLDQAEAVTRRYLELNPEDADAYRLLAATHLQAGDLAAARRAHEQAAFLDSGNPIAELSLARLAIRAGDAEEAQRIIAALEPKPMTDRQRFQVLSARRSALLHAGRVADALEVLAEQAALGRRFLPPLAQVFEIGMWRATGYALIGDRERALAMADEVRSGIRPPLDTLALFGHLGVYQLLEDRDAYRDTLATLERFGEQFQYPFIEPFLLDGRAQLQRWSGDLDGAVATYDRVIERTRSSVLFLEEPEMLEMIMLEKARTLRESGKPEPAAAVLETVLSTNPGMPLALLELARVEANRGRLDQARLALATVKARWSRADPEFLHLERLRGLEEELASRTAETDQSATSDA